ncbi:TetR family transcriptional regulator [Rugosimonospora acidiphila]|uniref:TetR family transcriptional regulator n=1 Tax=Rugosimonospora acidiphila TaxID=556531 RepID=A0ABP9RWU8_9ACTN
MVLSSTASSTARRLGAADQSGRAPQGGAAEPGLRERKKQRTRDALRAAAFELFARKGFEATTVEEIADAVEVSSRTFFRYFGGKDDVVLATIDDQYTDVLAAFELRPADEPVWTAMRRATAEVLARYESGETGMSAESFARVTGLVSVSPALTGRALELCTTRIDEGTQLIARRMGVRPEQDPRPALVAAVMLSAIQTATGAWRENEPDTPTSVLVDRAFELLGAGIDYPAA